MQIHKSDAMWLSGRVGAAQSCTDGQEVSATHQELQLHQSDQMYSISIAPGFGAQGGDGEHPSLQLISATGKDGLTASAKAKEQWGPTKLWWGVTELWSLTVRIFFF